MSSRRPRRRTEHHAGRQPLPSRFSRLRRRARRRGRRARARPASAAWSRSRPACAGTPSCSPSPSAFPTCSARSAPIRTTPHEELDITRGRPGRRAPAIPRWWRSARPGSTITTTTARATRRSRASAPTSRRRARPACRWSSMRARPTTTWRASSRRKRARAPSRPCCIASPAAASSPCAAIELGLYVSFTGILTFKNSDELRAIAAELPADRILVETDAPYLAPGKFRGKRNEPAYVVETARVLAETRGVALDEIARQTTRQFLPAVHQGAAASCGGGRMTCASRSSAAARPAACRGRRSAGAPAIPNNPKNRRRRCSLLVERTRRRRRHPRPGRHLAGPARAAARRRGRLARRRASTPTSTPTTPTASTTCARCSSASAGGSTSISTSRPRAIMHRALRLLLRDAARQRLSADRDRAPARAGPAGRRSTGRAAPITALPFLQDHGDIPSLGFRFGGCRLFLRPERPAGRRAWRRWPGSMCGSSTRCATSRIRAISASTEALAWIERIKPRRAILTNLHTDLDYDDAAREAAAACRAGLRRPERLGRRARPDATLRCGAQPKRFEAQFVPSEISAVFGL